MKKNKDISKKDLEDWNKYTKNPNDIFDKDLNKQSISPNLRFKFDLHGFSLKEADKKVEQIIIDCSRKHYKEILLITGKGLHYSGVDEQKAGILKKMVPIWLNEEPNRSKILSFSHAKPSDGGVGALYVLLKKSRLGKDA